MIMTIPMVLLLLTIIFFVLRVMPGDPVRAMVGEKASEEQVRRLREQLGLNKPYIEQYFDYLAGLLRGDLGVSWYYRGMPVTSLIMEKFPATLELAIGGTIVSLLLGILLAILAAYNQGSKIDRAVTLFGIISYSLFIPWLGILLQLLFSVNLKILPLNTRIDVEYVPTKITGLYVLDSILTGNILGFVNALQHLILPSITLGLVLTGSYLRITRNTMVEVLSQNFIKMARAKGLAERDVLFKHALKNTLIPLLTMMGLQFALLLGGAVLTETTFSWEGMGRFLVKMIEFRDYPTIQGIIIFYGLLVAVVSMIIDIMYALIDPRVRY